MSDFVSDFWDYYIGVTAILGILACAWLLWITSRTPAGSPPRDEDTPVGTTGHVWDEDLQELNNPLPRWWAGLFVITILFSLAYLVAYPGLGSYAGELKWTQSDQYKDESAAAHAATAPLYAQFAGRPVEQLAATPPAMAIGERLFMNNCAQCHGSDARGSRGFPNLTDQDWLYGGAPATLMETIAMGRHGVMPSMAAAVGGSDDVANVAAYVLSLSDSGGDPLKIVLGKQKFVTVCGACHGADGKGNQALGAPNLTDRIWLHGFGSDRVIDAIDNGHDSVMPPHGDKLTDTQIRLLAAYVWQLSNQVAPLTVGAAR